MANILLIDDDADLRTMYSFALKGAGHNVIMASDGETGLKLVGENPVDLILLDLMMPGAVDGMGFLQSYDPKQHLDVKVLVFTNKRDMESINEVMQMGVTGYIEKAESTPSKLVSVVESTLL